MNGGRNRRNKRTRTLRTLRGSTNVQTSTAVPAGSSGLVYRLAQLTENYFRDPRMIKIYAYTVRINIIDTTKAFLAYQVLSVLDDENNQPTVMTNPRYVNINGSTVTVNKPQSRQFFALSQAEFDELVIHFQAPTDTKIYLDVTTHFTIEKDLMNGLTGQVTVDPINYGRN